jgi:hypothetical protein
MRWRLVVAVVHTTEWHCVGPVATARRSVIEWRFVLTPFTSSGDGILTSFHTISVATGSSPVIVKKRKSTIPPRLRYFADDPVATTTPGGLP